MRQTTWTPVYFIAQLSYFISLVRPALMYPSFKSFKILHNHRLRVIAALL